ncbi:MAG: hypothetical protein WC603_01320 [Candidatus Paceibacterota bacterium]|jgi:hypothetical protein
MRKILPYILIVLIVVQLLAPFTLGRDTKNDLVVQNNKAEAADCEFISAEYNPFTTIEQNRVDETILTVTTKNCVDKFLKGGIGKKMLTGGAGETMLDFGTQSIENDVLSFRIQVGERLCNYKDCQTVLYLYIYETSTGEQELDSYHSTREIAKKDYLDFKCTVNADGTCVDARPWLVLSSQGSSTWTITPSVTSDSLTVSGTGPTQGGSSDFTETDTLTVSLSKVDGTLIKEEVYVIKQDLLKDGVITYSTTFTGLQPQTGYNVKLTTKFGEVLNNGIYTLTAGGQTYIPLPQDQKGQKTLGNNSDLPECVTGFLDISIGGCFAQLLYYALFKPTSFLFGLTGKILDFALFYSISDASYRSSFVVEGWGIVRDFCNMFFIFVLLYIAFGTILNLHSVKTKEAIINVVIIGLLINFSLFATHVIIDASNILTRVFYNQKTIAITEKDSDGNLVNKTGEFKELRLSEAIVSKVDPQKLIIQAKKVSDIPISSGVDEEKEETTKDGITTGAFIIVVLLATIVNVVGMIAFISCAIIFIARVLGLWLAMILAPIAFFSYTVPALKDMKMIGWTKWWPETLKLAFLAPIFAFFMYLIVGFMDKGLGIMDADSKTGMAFVVALVVPFVFIMLLLMQAKKIASNMSGEIGQSITKGIAAVGGIALGGAALGAAALGRGTVGGFLKGSATGDTAAQRYARGESKNRWDSIKGRIGSSLGGVQIQQGVGRILNRGTNRMEESAHGRHRLDEVSGQIYRGRKWLDLNGTERDAVRERINQNEAIRLMGPRFGTRTWAQLSAAERGDVNDYITDHGVNEAQNLVRNAQRKDNPVNKVLQSSAFGSYDIRNLAELIANEHDSGLSKFGVGLISTISKGMRGGLQQAGINFGKGQGEFMKDLGHTITEALKETSVKVDLTNLGKEEKGEAKKGSGHH